MDGHLSYWRELIAALRPERPVYGLTLPPTSRGDWRELAAACVRDLIAFQPAGPYHLAGYSFSAGLALEIAHQLRMSGRMVGVLAMIDYGPGEPRVGWAGRVSAVMDFITNLPYWLRYDILQCDLTSLTTRLRRKLSSVIRRATSEVSRTGDAERVVDQIFGQEALSHASRQTTIVNLQAFFDYEPQRYDGRVLLFWARCRPLLHSLGRTLGWEHYAAAFTRVVVACHHDNILKPPHVNLVAAALDDAMDRFSATAAVPLGQAIAGGPAGSRR